MRLPSRLLSAVAVLPFVALGLAATPAGAATEPVPVGGTVSPSYTVGASDGAVYNFGTRNFGSMANTTLAQPVVGMAGTPSGLGYWMVASDGGIFSFGDANYYGSTGDIALNKPIVGMSSAPGGDGYWFVAEDGGVFTFGNADYRGSTGDMTLNKPIVGMAATPSGDGYWLVATDGGIFSFGDADFHGSTGAMPLNKPIVGMAATPTGAGYWLVAEDGGIFTFGDANYHGSTGDKVLTKPIVDMATTPDGAGYWLVAEDGGIFNFGNAGFNGSAAGMRLNGRAVDVLPQGGDITAPKLHSLSFSESTIDTSAGSRTVTVRARLTDAVAGVPAPLTDPMGPGNSYSNSFGFYSPSKGQQVNVSLPTRISGDTHDGIYEGTVTFPAYSEQGTWAISYTQLYDRAGNAARPTTNTLAAAGHPTTIEQTGPGDITAPSLHSLSFSESTIDTSAGPRTVTVRARLTDAVAGVPAPLTDPMGPGNSYSNSFGFYSPSKGQQVNVSLPTRISGDTHDGIYEGTVTFPAYSEQGTWAISYTQLYDRAGNAARPTTNTLAAAGHPTTIEQTGPGDITAPSLHSLSFSESTIDTSAGPRTVTVRARLTDAVAGVPAPLTDPMGPGNSYSNSFGFYSPSKGQQVNVSLPTRISGDTHDGIYEGTVTFPAYSEQGTWAISYTQLYDRAGNAARPTTNTLAAAGHPTTIEVLRTS